MGVWILTALPLVGCADGNSILGPSTPAAVWPAQDTAMNTDSIAPLPLSGFSWVIEGQLAGMPLVGQYQNLEADLAWIAEQGVDLLVSLTEEASDPQQVTAAGMDPMHLPIEDFTPPEPEQIDEFVAEVALRLEAGEQVGVHCHGGLGRTGTLLATWFVWEGMTGDDAIAHVRDLRPGSIETEEQEEAVRTYEERLRAE